MFLKSVVLAAAALMLCGCLVTSLDPLYTDKDVVTDSGLVGNWTATSSSDSIFVVQQDAKTYRVILLDGEDKVPGAYDLRLVQLGKYRFYDFLPYGPGSGSDLWQGHRFPVHSFGRIERNGDTLRFCSLDQDWLKQKLQANPNLIDHRVSGDVLLLTSPTAELQKFLLAHVEQPGVLGEWSVYQRRR